ncbi:MAG: thiol peroxidase [Actinobacteria bacterium]|jgi:thiol peroxidase|nr:thiol peroxidase [Actinomycetota bacterium]
MAQTSFGGTPVNTVGDLPAPGASLPSFTLTAANLQDFSNADLAGKRVVFNIFPSVDTPTCAQSVRRFNEIASSLDNTVVYCVSNDLPFAQGRFCGSEGLGNVQNASGFRGGFGNAFGVLLNEGAFNGLLARAVVVADEKGNVLHTELVSDIANEPNYDAAISALK